MAMKSFSNIYTRDALKKLFPDARTGRFFDALFGDPTEGAYDIRLEFKGHTRNQLHFEFHLRQRPGKCLACHLTAGLPQVFARHSIIDINGLVKEIEQLLDGQAGCAGWKLGATKTVRRDLHVIPLVIYLHD